MTKRKEPSNTDRFSCIIHMPPIVDLLLTFLLPVIKEDEFLTYWTNKSTKDNDMFYLALCSVCKDFATMLKHLQRRFLCPYIASEQQALFWFAVMPMLSNVRMSHACYQPQMQYPNLRSLCLHEDYRQKLLVPVLNVNMPSLQNLTLAGYVVNTAILQGIAQAYPELKRFCVTFNGNETDVTVANFSHLEILSFEINHRHTECELNVHISDMPRLIDCEILDANFNMLHFGAHVGSLQRISSVNSEHFLKQLVFDEKVPLLVHINLGYSDSITCFDPLNNVNWTQVQKLKFGYDECCREACSQFLEMEELNITNANHNPNPCVPWHNLSKLTELNFTWPTNAMLESCYYTAAFYTTLTWLSIQWDKDTIVDFSLLVRFANLTFLSLDGSKYINFTSLFLLQNLKKQDAFHCGIALSDDDARLVDQWREKPSWKV